MVIFGSCSSLVDVGAVYSPQCSGWDGPADDGGKEHARSQLLQEIVRQSVLLSGGLSVSRAGLLPGPAQQQPKHACSSPAGPHSTPLPASWQTACLAAEQPQKQQQAPRWPVRRCLLCTPAGIALAGSSSITASGAAAAAAGAATAAAAKLSTPLPAAGRSSTAVAGSCSSSSTGAPRTCCCSCGAAGSGSPRPQQWLARMELQLQLPATPLSPPEDPCPAPRTAVAAAAAALAGLSSRLAETRKRPLGAAALAPLLTGEPGSGSSASSPQPEQDAPQQRSRKRRSCEGSSVAAAAAGVGGGVAAMMPTGSGCAAAAAIAAAVGGICLEQAVASGDADATGSAGDDTPSLPALVGALPPSPFRLLRLLN